MNKKLLSLIGTIFVVISFNISNSSSIKQELVNKNNDTQHDQKYWDEWLPVLKLNAKETLKDRFDYCTNWLLGLLESNDLLYKTTSCDYIIDYNIKSTHDIIDIIQLKKEIELRKILLNDIHYKDELNGNAWSEIPLTITGCNLYHKRKIGEYLQWSCGLIQNHWYMSFEKCYDNVKLNFYSSYEYQQPGLYQNSLNSEQTVSIGLSGIEMDLLTSNRSTSNIELFSNYLVFKRDNVALKEIKRYEKYLTREQNILLAKHILSYYLSFPGVKYHNIAKSLLKNYLLQDLFRNMRPNQFLSHINKVETDNWCEVIIQKYLDDEFATEYNKDYLKSFKSMIKQNKTKIINMLLPEFIEYATFIFNELVNSHNSKNNNTDNVAKQNRVKALFEPVQDLKIMGNIISYIDFKHISHNKNNSKK